MMHPSNTALRFCLLSLLAQQPRTGYELRKQFTETPLKQFSDSPGSIYPALHKLHELGLLEEVAPQSQSGRRKQVFQLTKAGIKELKLWLQKPVTRRDVVWGLDAVMLRFAFGGEILGHEFARRMLVSFHAALLEYIAELKAFYKQTSTKMSLTGRLALKSGIEGYAAQARWAKRCAAEFKRPAAK